MGGATARCVPGQPRSGYGLGLKGCREGAAGDALGIWTGGKGLNKWVEQEDGEITVQGRGQCNGSSTVRDLIVVLGFAPRLVRYAMGLNAGWTAGRPVHARLLGCRCWPDQATGCIDCVYTCCGAVRGGYSGQCRARCSKKSIAEWTAEPMPGPSLRTTFVVRYVLLKHVFGPSLPPLPVPPAFPCRRPRVHCDRRLPWHRQGHRSGAGRCRR